MLHGKVSLTAAMLFQLTALCSISNGPNEIDRSSLFRLDTSLRSSSPAQLDSDGSLLISLGLPIASPICGGLSRTKVEIMKRFAILFSLLLVLPLCIQSQENATPDNATSKPANERQPPIQAGRTSVFSLIESPKPKLNVDEASACPEGAGKPCALIGGRRYFDAWGLARHDRTWRQAMQCRRNFLLRTRKAPWPRFSRLYFHVVSDHASHICRSSQRRSSLRDTRLCSRVHSFHSGVLRRGP